jgi:hypothetical protein
MDPTRNPYRPGAGTRPLVLAGRDQELKKIETLLKTVAHGAPQRSLMFYGLRGVGKTVLLNAAEDMAEGLGYVVEHLEMAESDDFRRVIAKATRKLLLKVSTAASVKDKIRKALGVLKAFAISIPDGPELRIDVDAALGSADSGDIESDLVDLFLAVGDAARESAHPVCFIIDEVQYVDERAFAGLIAASHRIAQKALPIVFICAGLPQVAALSGDAKSYAERLFDFIPIANLQNGDAFEGLRGPARSEGFDYADPAALLIVRATDGYPYFIQEYGKHAWDIAAGSPITETEAQEAAEKATETLDRSFFKVRIDRATQGEKTFMRAMARIDGGPYKIADVAHELGKTQSQIGPVRASLIRKGFVYSPQHGYIDFTVPQFDRFLRRYLG